MNGRAAGKLSLYFLLLFAHVAGAIAMIAGIIGRELTMTQARRSDDVKTIVAFAQLAGRFDRLLVQPWSLVLFAAGIALSVTQGWALFGFLQGAGYNWLLVSLVLFLAMIPIIAFLFVPTGKVFDRALEAARSEGRVTPDLTAALHNRTVHAAHIVEAVLIVVVLYLMIAKPF